MDWNHQSYHELDMKYVGRIESAKNFKPDYSMWPTQSLNINGKGSTHAGFPSGMGLLK